ncbi:Mediator of RNA polymerase II transcription subunit 6 [Abeliophyllum distichum]|uniref:Mediator of RNA polymerase II transcription subunit 6 n=1 Tax=Abeliophyllum distichum TaxID=126358 RepID=A0ABD1NR28_9LAMI
MATTPMVPPNQAAAGNPNFDGVAPPPMAAPPPPGTDMTRICFRDQLWLNTYPLDRNLVFDYFALSPVLRLHVQQRAAPTPLNPPPRPLSTFENDRHRVRVE